MHGKGPGLLACCQCSEHPLPEGQRCERLQPRRGGTPSSNPLFIAAWTACTLRCVRRVGSKLRAVVTYLWLLRWAGCCTFSAAAPRYAFLWFVVGLCVPIGEAVYSSIDPTS